MPAAKRIVGIGEWQMSIVDFRLPGQNLGGRAGSSAVCEQADARGSFG